MVGKAAVSAVSLILVVGVALAVVAVVHHKNGTKSVGDNLSPSMKAMTAICGKTDHQEICQKTLSPVAEKGNMDPKEFLKAAIQSTINEVSKSLNFSDNLVKNVSSSPKMKMAVEDCKDLLQFAVAELQASFSMVGDSDIRNMNDRDVDLKNWLSAVISYQESCLDGFQDAPEYQSLVGKNLQDASLLTSNALAIVSELGDILKYFGLDFNIKPSGGRRLLSEDGYPSWFSASDRKLLALQNNGRIKPNVVVAKDGSGQFKSIAAALAAYPKNHIGRYVIYVKAGIYDEHIIVTKDQTNVFIYGDGPRKTIVTGKKSYRDGITTFQTATFSAIGEGFMAKSMGFRNTAGPEGHQAVALRVQSDRAIFYNCRMDGYQDTLYVQTHRQFYRNCVISGTVDFIFGDSATVIQNSLIIVRKPMDGQLNTVTAQGRKDKNEPRALVIHNCRIVPEQILFPLRFKIQTYLGRPWKEYARTVIMETTLADFINPAGYHPWAGNFALETCSYLEYGNRGPGANTNRRVKWKGVRLINRSEALQYTPNYFLHAFLWLKNAGVPYLPVLKH